MEVEQDEQKHPLILDFGCNKIKLGYAGSTVPSFKCSSFFVQDTKSGKFKLSREGNFSQLATNSKAKCYPMISYDDSHSPLVSDYDAFSFVLDETHELFAPNKDKGKYDNSVLIAEKCVTNANHRQKLTELLFETHSFESIFYAKSPTLACYATAKTSGLVADIGFNFSEICCIQNGMLLEGTLKHNNWSSLQVCELISGYLKSKNSKYFNDENIFLEGESNVKKIRELYKCENILKNYINFNFTPPHVQQQSQSEKRRERNVRFSKNKKEGYTLPDGSNIREVDLKRLENKVLEKVFEGENSLQQTIIESGLATSTSELKKYMFDNVVCCGGLANKNYFSSKLQNELNYLREGKFIGMIPEVKVSTAHIEELVGVEYDFENLVFTGGSIVASLSNFDQYTVSKQDYEEKGMIAFSTKCP